jgi:RimJ/RimL family protein N-acetyltransferase
MGAVRHTLLGAAMQFLEFAQFHLPGLQADEVRFNVQIALITAAMNDFPAGLQYWTLGEPGHCAIRHPGRAILLGALERGECHRLARETEQLDYPGVVGSRDTAVWFVEQANSLGIAFEERIPQRIHVITAPPQYPSASGSPRTVAADDAPLLFEWLAAFHSEAVPHDPPPKRENIGKAVASGRYVFWVDGDEPVSVAAIARPLRTTVALAPVYTPPRHRGRGYGGSVTATLVDRALAEGKTAVCLYTDLRNPASNRCYAKIGFRPYCDSSHFLRAPMAIAED